MRKDTCKKKKRFDRDQKRSDVCHTEEPFLILRSAIPTSVCNWSGIHVNDHGTISDTRHGLWWALHSGYTSCNQGKMEDREEIQKAFKVKAKVILQSANAYTPFIF